MNLKIIIITIFTFLSLSNLSAQSKKEQILILSNKIDSLNSVLNNERSLSLEKIKTLNSEIDLIKKKLVAANDELVNASKDLDKKRVDAASYSSENKRLESDLTSLKEENLRLQFKLDSIEKHYSSQRDVEFLSPELENEHGNRIIIMYGKQIGTLEIAVDPDMSCSCNEYIGVIVRATKKPNIYMSDDKSTRLEIIKETYLISILKETDCCHVKAGKYTFYKRME
jgi:hypothetical protein